MGSQRIFLFETLTVFRELPIILTPSACHWWSLESAKLFDIFLCSQMPSLFLNILIYLFTFVSDNETLFTARGPIIQQDMHEEKISNKQEIAKFTRSNSCIYILAKNGEDQSIEDEQQNHGRPLRWGTFEVVVSQRRTLVCHKVVKHENYNPSSTSVNSHGFNKKIFLI